MDYQLKILVYLHMRKEGNNPRGFSITDTDFCIYIRDRFLCICERQEGRKYSLWIIYYRYIFLCIC